MSKPAWSGYEFQPSFVLGFHGCTSEVGEKILSGKETHLLKSEKRYDWLGHGIYFWEGNPTRAYQWAVIRCERKQDGSQSFVLGAIIDLRRCLDLFDQGGTQQVAEAYKTLKIITTEQQLFFPENTGKTDDKALRTLDCAVIQTLHAQRSEINSPAYDSVRGPFLEGSPIYDGAGFRDLNHIQLCIRNYACIKGYFRPIQVP